MGTEVFTWTNGIQMTDSAEVEKSIKRGEEAYFSEFNEAEKKFMETYSGTVKEELENRFGYKVDDFGFENFWNGESHVYDMWVKFGKEIDC